MENNFDIPIALPDWRSVHRQLIGDYKKILRTKLEEYKDTDISITPWNMTKLLNIGETITKQDILNVKSILHTTYDNENNGFLHHAVEKNDVSIVQWFAAQSNVSHLSPRGKNGQTPFDLCIKKLLPEVPNDATKAITRRIFDVLVRKTLSFKKEYYWSQISVLQLKHKKYGSEFKVNLLEGLSLPDTIKKILSNYYRDAQEEKDGYTFTHVFATQCKADDLFELVKKDQISFKKDKHNYTALDYALSALHKYIQPQQETCITQFPDVLQQASCCVYILLNHAKALAQKEIQNAPDVSDISDFGPCCEKHTLLKAI
jgi:hypothetical protein